VNPNPAKLFVGNLSFKTSHDELVQYFQTAGTVVDAVILTDKFTGRSRGFGFVEMGNADEANKAREMFNGKEFQGRELIVNDARPEQPREPMEGGQAPMDAGATQPMAEEAAAPVEAMPQEETPAE
jgi:RNA recognition motif-containing protein